MHRIEPDAVNTGDNVHYYNELLKLFDIATWRTIQGANIPAQ